MIPLPVVTSSRIKVVNRCKREHQFAYIQRRRPVETAEDLAFGSLVHKALEAYLGALDEAVGGPAPLDAAIFATDDSVCDGFLRAKARAMLKGYVARWLAEDRRRWDVLAVEKRFGPLVNPGWPGAEGQAFLLDGKLDGLIRDKRNSEVFVLEHKTSSEDITAGAPYWKRLRLDTQPSVYYDGSAALGYKISGIIYDMIKKPTCRPLKATPESRRKYRKGDGQLYEGQRAADETPAEYEARCIEEIAAAPDQFYVRGVVVRLASEMAEARRDVAASASAILAAANGEFQPRNPDACFRYGKFCPYHGVCTGEARIEDDALFRTSSENPELEEESK